MMGGGGKGFVDKAEGGEGRQGRAVCEITLYSVIMREEIESE